MANRPNEQIPEQVMTSPRPRENKADRKLVRLFVAGEQPYPIQTMLIERADGNNGLVRRWADGDPQRCNLCRVCNAIQGSDGQWQCYKEVNGRIDPESGPLFALP